MKGICNCKCHVLDSKSEFNNCCSCNNVVKLPTAGPTSLKEQVDQLQSFIEHYHLRLLALEESRLRTCPVCKGTGEIEAIVHQRIYNDGAYTVTETFNCTVCRTNELF